jgi:hypothetical protein
MAQIRNGVDWWISRIVQAYFSCRKNFTSEDLNKVCYYHYPQKKELF